MAQALINNLTNTITDTFSANNTQEVVSDLDFGQLLDMQTIADSTEIIADAENIISEAVQESIAETLDTLIGDSTLTAAIEIAVDAVTENVTEQASETVEDEITGDVLDSEENVITEEEDDTNGDNNINNNNNNNNNDTITQNEDPTMNKQLQTTLENSTALYVLQSQTNLKQQNVSQTQESDNALPTEHAVKLTQRTETETAEKFTIIDPSKSQPKEKTSNVKTLRDIVDEKVLKELDVQSVSSSEEGEAAGNLMQYQTPQEQAVKVMLHSDIKFENLKDVSVQNQAKPQEISSGRILEQISKQMEGMYNSSKVNIVLNPASLGKVVLQMINSKEGLLAHFTVTSPETQNILMKGLAGLKESLLAQGINVDNVVIKLSESEMYEEESGQDWTEKDESGGGQKEQGARKQKQEKRNFEQTMFEMNQTWKKGKKEF